MSPPAVEARDVAKRFRLIHERNTTLKATIFSGFRRTVHEEFWALDGVSFGVAEGETFGIIGHNGSGKSTLLKCIARIYRPDRGTIATRGRVSALLELGAGFHPELSGRENVYLNGSILGMSKRDIARSFDDIVAFAGLEQFIDTPVKNYSSGMYVRLGFSIAITVEPDILLIDEILAVGDQSFQERCMEKFAELRRAGRTIVLVTHSLDSVRNMCERAAWIDHGSLVKQGPAYDVVTAYLESVRDDRRSHEATESAALDTAGPSTGWSIQAVELLDGKGAETSFVTSGSPLTIRVHLRAPADEDATLALDLYRTDGAYVAGPIYRFRTGGPGEIVIEYVVPRLPLTAGTYDVASRLLDSRLQRTHAVEARAARLDVTCADEPRGLVALEGSWQRVDEPEASNSER